MGKPPFDEERSISRLEGTISTPGDSQQILLATKKSNPGAIFNRPYKNGEPSVSATSSLIRQGTVQERKVSQERMKSQSPFIRTPLRMRALQNVCGHSTSSCYREAVRKAGPGTTSTKKLKSGAWPFGMLASSPGANSTTFSIVKHLPQGLRLQLSGKGIVQQTQKVRLGVGKKKDQRLSEGRWGEGVQRNK